MSLVTADDAVLSIGATPVGGLTRRRFALQRGTTDRAHRQSAGWAEHDGRARPMSVEIHGEGLLLSGVAMTALRAAFLSGAPEAFSLDLPGDGTWSGAFVLRHLEFTGRAEREMGFSLRMVSSGPVTFTPQSGD